MNVWNGLNTNVRSAEPLAPFTWFGLGGPAEYYAEPETIDDLATLLRRAREHELPVRLLGGGSNVLIADAGVPGLVVRVAEPRFARIEVRGTTVTAGAGAKLGHVVSTSVREGLGGLEPLVGIPGTIGGALHGNSGSRSGDIGQWAQQATVMNRAGEVIVRQREEMTFAYRQSSLDDLVILEAVFELETDDPVELTKRMQKQWITKKGAQPLASQSAGCIFKNPRGMSAGMLIDQAGLKGARVGGAEVSARHANFIIAERGATALDVVRLIDLVKSRVSERLGIDLDLEIEVWK